MNDRFKLRAFYKGKMYPVGAIFYKMEKVKIGKHLVKIDELDSPLMQATGNRDKAETPIYEGDVIRVNDFFIEWEPFNVAVEYDEEYGSFRMEGEDFTGEYDKSDYPFNMVVECDCEVIGNIYQNPEMMEAKK